jgi:hypothetical protein
MDRFKDDFESWKDLERQITDNLKERHKAIKAGLSTTKVSSASRKAIQLEQRPSDC